jgi:hypothetical protein
LMVAAELGLMSMGREARISEKIWAVAIM